MARTFPFPNLSRRFRQVRDSALTIAGSHRIPRDGKGLVQQMRERPELSDPEKPDSELLPTDFKETDADREMQAAIDRAGGEKKIVDFVVQEQRRSANRRQRQELDWALARAFYEDRQYLMPDENATRLTSFLTDEDKEHYFSVNLLEFLARKYVALATQSMPDATAAPLTDAPKDRRAAEEHSSINAHMDRQVDRAAQVKALALWSVTSTTAYVKLYWDADAMALIPDYDDQGQVAGAQMARVGELREDIVPGFEVFNDPLAYHEDDVRWRHHVKLQPLAVIQERFGERGKKVQPEPIGGAVNGYVDAYINGAGWGNAGGAGGFGAPGPAGLDRMGGQSGAGIDKAAYVIERHELPTDDFELGRLIIIANGVLLYYKEELPVLQCKNGRYWDAFVPLAYKDVAGTGYGGNLLSPCLPLQVAFNKEISTIQRQSASQKDYVLLDEGSEVNPSVFDYGKPGWLEKIPYKTGMGVPQIARGPGIEQSRFALLDFYYQRMQDLVGIHDVMNGKPEGGATSGISINLLQEGDQSQLSLFVSRIERAVVRVKELEALFYAKYATLPRLMGLDETGTPGTAQGQQPQGPTPPMAPPLQGLPGGGFGAPVPATAPIGADDEAAEGEGGNAAVPGMDGIAPQMPQMPQEEAQEGMQAPAPPQTPQSISLSRAMTFKALFSGGQSRVVVTPGSGMPKSQAGKQQQAIELYNMGVLGPPGTPKAARMLVQLLSLTDSGPILAHIDQWQADEEVAQQALMQIQQQQMAAAAMQQAQEASQSAKPPVDPIQLEQVKQEGETQRAVMDHQASTAQMVTQAQLQALQGRQQDESETRRMLLQHALDAQMARLTAGADAQKARLQTGLDIQKIKATPPKPAPAKSGGKK